MQLGLPDPDHDGPCFARDKDMHSALVQASAAAAVVGTIQHQARKALSGSGMLSTQRMRRLSLDIEGALKADFTRRRWAAQ